MNKLDSILFHLLLVLRLNEYDLGWFLNDSVCFLLLYWFNFVWVLLWHILLWVQTEFFYYFISAASELHPMPTPVLFYELREDAFPFLNLLSPAPQKIDNSNLRNVTWLWWIITTGNVFNSIIAL